MTAVFALTAQQTMGIPPWRGLLATLVVLGLLGALAWLVRKGHFGLLGKRSGAIAIESSCSLGERRLLVIVGVDGRRLLLGMTPDRVSLLTELAAAAPAADSFATVLDKRSGDAAGGAA